MIRNRLAEIMFERDIKVVRMAKDIDISRNTITNTASNNSEMLQMKTINKICKYLDITPCEFFEYTPIDIEFTFFENNKIDLIEDYGLQEDEYLPQFEVDLLIDILLEEKEIRFDTKLIAKKNTLSVFPNSNNILKVGIDFDKPEHIDEITDIFQSLSRTFRKQVYNDLTDSYRDFLLTHFDKSEKNPFNLTKYEIIKNMKIEIANDFMNYY